MIRSLISLIQFNLNLSSDLAIRSIAKGGILNGRF